MTRLIIRAMRERQECVDYLSAHLPDAEFCFDQTRNAMDTFLSALDLAGDDPVVHMEEDIWLAEGFRDKLEAAIAEKPDSVIQFFSMRTKDLTIGSRWDYGYSFLMAQCFYVPAGMSKRIRDYFPGWAGIEKHPTGLDTMVADFFADNKIKYWIHVPSLVDHRVGPSMIDKRRKHTRVSKTFGERLA